MWSPERLQRRANSKSLGCRKEFAHTKFYFTFLGSQLSFPDVVQESIKLDFKLGSKHTALLESPERYFSGVILVALENFQKVLFSCLCIVTAPGHSLP